MAAASFKSASKVTQDELQLKLARYLEEKQKQVPPQKSSVSTSSSTSASRGKENLEPLGKGLLIPATAVKKVQGTRVTTVAPATVARVARLPAMTPSTHAHVPVSVPGSMAAPSTYTARGAATVAAGRTRLPAVASKLITPLRKPDFSARESLAPRSGLTVPAPRVFRGSLGGGKEVLALVDDDISPCEASDDSNIEAHLEGLENQGEQQEGKEEKCGEENVHVNVNSADASPPPPPPAPVSTTTTRAPLARRGSTGKPSVPLAPTPATMTRRGSASSLSQLPQILQPVSGMARKSSTVDTSSTSTSTMSRRPSTTENPRVAGLTVRRTSTTEPMSTARRPSTTEPPSGFAVRRNSSTEAPGHLSTRRASASAAAGSSHVVSGSYVMPAPRPSAVDRKTLRVGPGESYDRIVKQNILVKRRQEVEAREAAVAEQEAKLVVDEERVEILMAKAQETLDLNKQELEQDKQQLEAWSARIVEGLRTADEEGLAIAQQRQTQLSTQTALQSQLTHLAAEEEGLDQFLEQLEQTTLANTRAFQSDMAALGDKVAATQAERARVEAARAEAVASQDALDAYCKQHKLALTTAVEGLEKREREKGVKEEKHTLAVQRLHSQRAAVAQRETALEERRALLAKSKKEWEEVKQRISQDHAQLAANAPTVAEARSAVGQWDAALKHKAMEEAQAILRGKLSVEKRGENAGKQQDALALRLHALERDSEVVIKRTKEVDSKIARSRNAFAVFEAEVDQHRLEVAALQAAVAQQLIVRERIAEREAALAVRLRAVELAEKEVEEKENTMQAWDHILSSPPRK